MKNEKAGIIASFSIKITVGFLLVIFAIGISLLFVLYPTYRVELTFISAMIGGSATIYSAFYAGLGIRNKIQQDKLAHSFDLMKLTKIVDLVRARTKLESEFEHGKVAPDDFYSKVVEDEEVHTAIKALLSLFEDISIAIQLEFADEKAIFLSQNTLLPYMYQTFLPYINEIRKRRKDNRVFCELEKLANAWNSGKYLHNGSIIPTEDGA